MIRHAVASFVVALFVFTTTSPMAAALPQSTDFGFRLAVRDCPTETFDSFSGLFTKELGGPGFPRPSATTLLALSAQQMQTVSANVAAIEFFDYPARFVGIPIGQHEVTTTVPYLSYRLEVRSGGRSHAVSWDDNSKPTTVAADRLRNLLSLIIQALHDHPAYKQLPPAIGGCE